MKTTVLEQVQIAVEQFSYSTGGVCAIYSLLSTPASSVYVVCSYYVESNSVFVVVDDGTIAAESQTRSGGHENTYGMRNRRRNVYGSLEVWMLWLDCLSMRTVHGAYV